MEHKKTNRLSKVTLMLVALFTAQTAFAAGPPKPSELSNPLAITLLIVIVGLLLAIGLLANVVLGAANIYLQRYKDEKKKTIIADAAKVVTVLLLTFMSTAAMAQDATAATAVSDTIGGLSSTSFYALIIVIGIELVIIFALLLHLKSLIANEALAVDVTEDEKVLPSFSFNKWWDKVNSFRPIKEEAAIDLGHNYDGIRELDNRLPPWWLYGFYITILFAGIYLYRYHVAHSAPLSHEELQIALDKGEADKAAYLAKSANNVDENTVKLLTDASDLEAGKKIFTTTCAACHLADGGGLVGPNLTDDYWLHGGSVKEIFKTIKYGVQEKGMKSWKDDYSPIQLAQITSYVKSLHGTKPATPKDPQGELVKEDATAPATADSTKAK